MLILRKIFINVLTILYPHKFNASVISFLKTYTIIAKFNPKIIFESSDGLNLMRQEIPHILKFRKNFGTDITNFPLHIGGKPLEIANETWLKVYPH